MPAARMVAAPEQIALVPAQRKSVLSGSVLGTDELVFVVRQEAVIAPLPLHECAPSLDCSLAAPAIWSPGQGSVLQQLS